MVQIISFSQPCYISVYRLLFHLKILLCLCVATSWFATIPFPVSAYIGSLCARTSMPVNPKHQYIVFLKQFLKGGFYTEKKRTPPAAEITRSSNRRFLHTLKGKFLFHSPLPLCILSQFKHWRFPLLAQREVSTPEKSAIALSTYVCTAMHSCYRKSEISTLHNLFIKLYLIQPRTYPVYPP